MFIFFFSFCFHTYRSHIYHCHNTIVIILFSRIVETGWGGMLVCRRLLLIAAAIAASIEVGSASYRSSISSDNSGNPGTTSSEVSSSSPETSGSPTEIAETIVCRPSEYLCGTGQCVAQDKYCDGENDCGDKSDEPRYCTRE